MLLMLITHQRQWCCV